MRDAQIKSLFNCKAKEVQLGLIELQKLIDSFNGNQGYSIDMIGFLRRFWTSVRSIILGYNRMAIINDTEYSEFDAMNEYRKISSLYLPPKVRVLVLRLAGEAQKNYDEIKAMRQSIKLMAN